MSSFSKSLEPRVAEIAALNGVVALNLVIMLATLAHLAIWCNQVVPKLSCKVILGEISITCPTTFLAVWEVFRIRQLQRQRYSTEGPGWQATMPLVSAVLHVEPSCVSFTLHVPLDLGAIPTEQGRFAALRTLCLDGNKHGGECYVQHPWLMKTPVLLPVSCTLRSFSGSGWPILFHMPRS